jgi:hypothetical protein
MPAHFPAQVDRHNLVAVLRAMIAAAEALPRERLHRRIAHPAGIPLELWFDDEAEAELNAPRLAAAAPDARGDPARLYVLTAAGFGAGVLPAWTDTACDAAEFQAIVANAGLRAAYPFRPQEWLALDTAAAVGVQLARATADLPDWFAGAPLRQHLHWLLQARGARIAHAASVGRDGRGILLLGHGGAGKSGTALAGIAAGLQTVGDDYVALSGIAPAVARPLFRVVKQDRAGLSRIAGLAERLAQLPENWKGKVEFDPKLLFPGCFAEALRIDAIVLPHIAHASQPRFEPAGAGEAMRALMRSNLYQFPGEPEDGLAYYGMLLRSVPVHRLALSDSAADNGAALAAFIGDLR